MATDRYYDDGIMAVRVDPDGAFLLSPSMTTTPAAHVIDMGRFHAMATLLRGITDATRVHAVNTPLLAAAGEA